MMKKAIAICFSFSLLVSCGKEQNKSSAANTKNPTTTQTKEKSQTSSNNSGQQSKENVLKPADSMSQTSSQTSTPKVPESSGSVPAEAKAVLGKCMVYSKSDKAMSCPLACMQISKTDCDSKPVLELSGSMALVCGVPDGCSVPSVDMSAQGSGLVRIWGANDKELESNLGAAFAASGAGVIE